MVNDNDTSQELEDIARAFKQDKDTQPIEQDLSPDPTPKLTAEEQQNWDAIYQEELVTPTQIEHDKEIRRQAFEEVAEDMRALMRSETPRPDMEHFYLKYRALAKAEEQE